MWRVDGAKVIVLTWGYLADDCQKSAEAIGYQLRLMVVGKGQRITRGKVGKFKGYAKKAENLL